MKLLILEDNPNDADLLQLFLRRSGVHFDATVASDRNEFVVALASFTPDAILSDHSLPQFTSQEALQICRQKLPHVPFILVTGSISDELAANIIKLGADDYIIKDRLSRLPAAISAAIKQRLIEKEKEEMIEHLKQNEKKFRALVERVSDGFIAIDLNWDVIYINKKGEEFFNRPPGYLTGKNIWNEFPEAINEPFHKAYRLAMETQENVLIKEYSFARDKWVEANIYPSPTGISVYLRDITEQKLSEQKIIQSEENLKAIFDNASEGFILADSNGTIKAFNEIARDNMLLTSNRILEHGESVFTAFEIPGEKLFKKAFQKAMEGEIIQYDRSYIKNDGSITWINFTFNPVRKDDHINGICITGRDVTKNKVSEQEKEFDSNNLKALINNTDDLIWSVDNNLKLITFNNAFHSMITPSPGQPLARGLEVLSTQHEKDQLERYKLFYQRALSGEAFAVINHLTFPTELWSEISFYPIHRGKNIVGTACFSRDITKSRKAEEALRQSELRLNEAQAITHISSWEVDLVQGIHTWSAEFYRILGLDEALTKPSTKLFLSFIHPSDADFVEKTVRKAFDTFTDSSYHFRFIGKDGSTRHGYVECKFEFDSRQMPFRSFGIFKDITERTAAEQALKSLEKEIFTHKIQEQKKIARAILTAQEKERNRLGQELHDNINQILVVTKLYLDMAGSKDAQVKKLIEYPLELIDSSTEEIRTLCSRLVTPLKNINLEEAVNNLIVKINQSTTTKSYLSYAVSNKILSDDLKLNIYRSIQEQVNNILKYAAAKNVRISIKTQGEFIRIIVEDDGKGFDIKSKRKGIGISNIINRIESFNGEVEIETSPGKGCKISMSVPYHIPHN